MNANEITLAANAHDLERLHAYLAHFADHLSSHCVDVSRYRENVDETVELTRLLDVAMADLEASHHSMTRVVAHLSKAVDTHFVHEHGHSHR